MRLLLPLLLGVCYFSLLMTAPAVAGAQRSYAASRFHLALTGIRGVISSVEGEKAGATAEGKAFIELGRDVDKVLSTVEVDCLLQADLLMGCGAELIAEQLIPARKKAPPRPAMQALMMGWETSRTETVEKLETIRQAPTPADFRSLMTGILIGLIKGGDSVLTEESLAELEKALEAAYALEEEE